MRLVKQIVIASAVSLGTVTTVRALGNSNGNDRSTASKVALSMTALVAAISQLSQRNIFEIRDEVAVLDT